MKTRILFLAVGTAAATLCGGAQAQTPSLTGQKLPARLITPLKSKFNKVGDVVKASITADFEGVPSGSLAVGKVTEVSPKEGNNAGRIKVVFNKISIGKSSITIVGKPVDVGYESGKDKSKKKTGTGAAAGAATGLLIGSNDLTSALVGGAVGAGVGAASSKGKVYDIDLKEGTKFKVLIESVTKPSDIKVPAGVKVPKAVPTTQ